MSVWQSQEWKEKAAAFVEGKECEWCRSTEKLVPHHPKKKDGYTREEYLNLEGCKVLCSKCNFMENKGYKLCPECKKNYYKPSRKKDPLCWDCFSQTPFGKKVKEYYDKNPDKRKKRKRK